MADFFQIRQFRQIFLPSKFLPLSFATLSEQEKLDYYCHWSAIQSKNVFCLNFIACSSSDYTNTLSNYLQENRSSSPQKRSTHRHRRSFTDIDESPFNFNNTVVEETELPVMVGKKKNSKNKTKLRTKIKSMTRKIKKFSRILKEMKEQVQNMLLIFITLPVQKFQLLKT